MPPVQAGMEPSALPAFSPPSGVEMHAEAAGVGGGEGGLGAEDGREEAEGGQKGFRIHGVMGAGFERILQVAERRSRRRRQRRL